MFFIVFYAYTTGLIHIYLNRKAPVELSIVVLLWFNP